MKFRRSEFPRGLRLCALALVWGATCRAGWCAPHAAGEAPSTAPADSARGAEFFEKRVRPVLAESCQQCHGPLKQKAGLRLDSRDALFKGGDSGPPVVPGDPDASLLVRAINYDDPDLQMPPASMLGESQIADLTEWVRMGAPWPDDVPGEASAADSRRGFWAFQPVARVAPPEPADATRPRTPVDAFILAGLEAKGLSPAPPADRRTLLRRVTFDLTGLPPAANEIEAFVEDESPEAFEKVVDRLLASPQYGERWARHWLDVVAYAETDGHEYDVEKPNAWRYRDYVVRAFNDDLPYDRFVTEHFAGDLIPPRVSADGERNESILGTGFYYLGEVLNSPVDSEQALSDRIDRQIDVIGKGFLGLTVSCARCHYHKFDPISQEDYYALAGVLRSSRMRQACADSPGRIAAQRDVRRGILWNELELGAWRARALNEADGASPTPAAARDARARSTTDSGIEVYEDFSEGLRHEWIPAGPAFEGGVAAGPVSEYQRMAGSGLARDGGHGYLSSGRASDRLHGRMISPIFVTTKSFVHFRAAGWGKIQIVSDESYDIPAIEVKSGDEFKWRTSAVKAFIGKNNYIELSDLHSGASLVLDCVVFSDSARPPKSLDPDPPDGEETSARFKSAADYEGHPGHDDLMRLMERRRELETGLEESRFALTAADDVVGDARLYIRGNHKTPGDVIPRRFIEVIAGEDQEPFAYGSGRLELARAITDPANPLTARVMANRIWLHLFGRGIVRTPDDFGAGGIRPTHPALLDHLASEFVEGGWSVKNLIRAIVLSDAYRMSSAPNGESEAADAANEMFHRQNPRRLEAEAIRDAILAVSGRLDLTPGGESVAPWLTEYMDGRGRPDKSGPLDGGGRRSIYLAVRRNFINPMFLAFDYPVPASPIGMRGSSTVPAQALILMNNPFVVGQADLWGGRVLASAARTDAERVESMYVSAFGRPPSAAESRAALEFVGSRIHAAQGDSSPESAQAAWASLAHALFNVAEFIYVR